LRSDVRVGEVHEQQTGGIIFPLNYTVWGKVINTLPSGHVTVTLNITSPNGVLLFKTDAPVFPHTLSPRQEGSFTCKFTSHDLRGYTGNDWTYYVSVSKQ